MQPSATFDRRADATPPGVRHGAMREPFDTLCTLCALDTLIVALASGRLRIERMHHEPLLALRQRADRMHPELAWQPVYRQ